MAFWAVVQSCKQFDKKHIPRFLAVCSEELKGLASDHLRADPVWWKMASPELVFESREEAEGVADSLRKLTLLERPENQSKIALPLPCGCLVNTFGRTRTCHYWRRAGGELGRDERILPKETQAWVRRYLSQIKVRDSLLRQFHSGWMDKAKLKTLAQKCKHFSPQLATELRRIAREPILESSSVFETTEVHADTPLLKETQHPS